VVSEGNYAALRDACLAACAARGLPSAADGPASLWNACLLAPCCRCCADELAGDLARELETLVSKRQGAWACHALGIQLHMTERAPRNGPACDQDGVVLTVWPPPGLNLVLYTPTRELRSRWPRPGQAGHAPYGAPVDAQLAALLGRHGLAGADVVQAVAATGARTVDELSRLTEDDVWAMPQGALDAEEKRHKLVAAVNAVGT
jgi:hypothetical protein